MKSLKQPFFLTLTALLVWFAAPAILAQDADSDAAANPALNATNNPGAAASSETSSNSLSNAAPSAKTDDNRIYRDEVVAIGHDADLRADEGANDVVAVFGSTKVRGPVTGNVVAVFGDVDIDSEVDGEVVSVFGDIHAGSHTLVHGDTVSVGGVVTHDPGAKFRGKLQMTAIDVPGPRGLNGLRLFFSQCILKLRPLSFRLGWIWPVAGVFFLIYLLIAAAFPSAVRASVVTLDERPITALAVGILGWLALGIIYILLVVTVIGILAVPFIQLAVIVAFLVGKVAILESLGAGLGRTARVRILEQPLAAFLLGALIITLVYTVPFLGLLTYLFVSAWGFGAATTAAYLHLRRERRAPPAKPLTPITPAPPPGPAPFAMPLAGAAMAAAAASHISPPVSTPPPPSASAFPTAPAPAVIAPPLSSATTPAAAAVEPSAPIAATAPGPSSPPLSSGNAPLGTGLPFEPLRAVAATTSAGPSEPPPQTIPPLHPPPPPPGAMPPPPHFTGSPAVNPAMPIPTAFAYPRVGFWLRVAAAAIDLVLLIILGHVNFGLFFLLSIAYFTAMVAWKGTTIGGIILRLQVVRADGQAVTWLVALVRALAGFFSTLILGLGFFWIAWDSEKQGWHDKIAGTVVVRLPHAPALICL